MPLFEGHEALAEANKWVPRREGAREWAAREGKLGVSENSVRHNSRFRAVSVQTAAADRERITKPP